MPPYEDYHSHKTPCTTVTEEGVKKKHRRERPLSSRTQDKSQYLAWPGCMFDVCRWGFGHGDGCERFDFWTSAEPSGILFYEAHILRLCRSFGLAGEGKEKEGRALFSRGGERKILVCIREGEAEVYIKARCCRFPSTQRGRGNQFIHDQFAAAGGRGFVNCHAANCGQVTAAIKTWSEQPGGVLPRSLSIPISE